VSRSLSPCGRENLEMKIKIIYRRHVAADEAEQRNLYYLLKASLSETFDRFFAESGREERERDLKFAEVAKLGKIMASLI
jgi:hypothetical protein